MSPVVIAVVLMLVLLFLKVPVWMSVIAGTASYFFLNPAVSSMILAQRLASSVQDQGNNYTRFICIAKDLEIYPGADRTSLMMVLPHKPGSLYKVLSRFYALGINLNKLESRPLPERDFEFMFYFDLETSVYSPQFQQLMGELPVLCEEFSYLGSYREVV